MNDFHALMAQVIPVLFLAAAFESKVLQQRPMRYGAEQDPGDEVTGSRVSVDTNFTQSVMRGVFIVFIGIGEAIAILCVYTGRQLPWQNTWVFFAGIFTLIMVISPLVQLHYKDFRDALKLQNAGWRTWPWSLSSLLFIVFMLWLLVTTFTDPLLLPTNPG